MEKIGIIFPHQLFENNPLIKAVRHIYIIEEHLFFKQYKFHKQKILFHRASMKYYESFLLRKNIQTTYIASNQTISDIRNFIPEIAAKGVTEIHTLDITDDWLEKRVKKSCNLNKISLKNYESPMFLNSKKMLRSFFEGKSIFRQTGFYIEQRKKWKLLLEKDNKPIGGKWTFDLQNRLKYPKTKSTPKVIWPLANKYISEARQYVLQHFHENYGVLSDTTYYPVTHTDAKRWFENFLENRFSEFGTYQDSMVLGEMLLHHSLLSPLLNSGLLTPDYIIHKSISFATDNNISINSLEGFVRQIVGWREFLRGVYILSGKEQRSFNFWQFHKKIPEKFWTANTGILPVDDVILKVLKTGYAHHIERLMILGNFMLLCEFNPDEVYKWFMELFIDSYDWVMVPNVYGMSQFADGGRMATKPYISSSNYIRKMSNYPKGEWQNIWDALFWRFLNTHRTVFRKNPRLNMLVRNFDKMPAIKQNEYLSRAEGFLETL